MRLICLWFCHVHVNWWVSFLCRRNEGNELLFFTSAHKLFTRALSKLLINNDDAC